MNVKDLIPWNRESNRLPASYRDPDPFMTLHREVNRLFDDVWRGFDMPAFGRLPGLSTNTRSGWSRGWPNVEVSETDKEIRVTAEVPGLEDKDVEVLLDGDVLTVRGEKKSESEDKERQFSERLYGRFERRIALGADVEADQVQANFKNGVLTVSLPKTEQAQSKAKISINAPLSLAEILFKSLPDDVKSDLSKKGYHSDNVWEQLSRMPPGKILEIEGDDGGRIQIWIE